MINSDVILTNLTLQLEDLIAENKLIETRLNTLVETQNIGEIQTIDIKKKPLTRSLILGLLSGLILSLFIVYFLSIFQKQFENENQ